MTNSNTHAERSDDARELWLRSRNRSAIIDSPLLSASGFQHAFFSRLGGVSLPPFESLNFSITVGDQEEAVTENLARAAKSLDVAPQHILFLNQVHGIQCHTVDRRDNASEFRKRQGDAVLSRDPQVACCVRVADCVPILLADPSTGWVAAVHSGWRGTQQNIASAAIARLRALGAGKNLIAAVGPHIQECCFEVSPEVAQSLLEASPNKNILRPGKRDRPHVSLRDMIQAQLRQAGVEQIDHVRGCTYCEPERFFSYRREGKRSGRHLAAIVGRDL